MFFFGFNLFSGLLGFILLPLAFLAALWTWKDARNRNMRPWLWSSIAFSIFPVGFLIYGAARYAGDRNKLK